MIAQSHYCSRQEEMKERMAKWSWGVPLCKLVMGTDGLANCKLTSSCQGKGDSPLLLEHIAWEYWPWY